MLALEKTVSREILDNVRKTLTPYLGLRNFQISVAARLNTDKKQTNETIFNPDSRVERSVRSCETEPAFTKFLQFVASHGAAQSAAGESKHQ